MKKRIVSIVTAIMLALTCAFVMPTVTHNDDAFAKAKSKYVKVLKKTYNNMKKTISSQKKTIAAQKKTISARDTTIKNQSTAIQNQSKMIESQKATINEKENALKDKKQQVSWLWSTLEEFGYQYNYDSHKWEAVATSEPEPLDWTETMYTTDVIPSMQEQTGLVIDNVQIIETYKNWACYYVEADGDLYVITMKKNIVDVCQILN